MKKPIQLSMLLAALISVCKLSASELQTNLFLTAVDDGKDVPIYCKAAMANYSGWMKKHASANAGFTAKMPLRVPVDAENLKRIQKCLGYIINDDVDILPYKVFDAITIDKLADLLIYSWYLDIKVLLDLAGPDFVEQIKLHHLNDFAQIPDYLSKVITANCKPKALLSSDGRAQHAIEWQAVISALKTWLNQFVLSDEEQTRLRANLVNAISDIGVVERAQNIVPGDCRLLSGRSEGGSFCVVKDVKSPLKKLIQLDELIIDVAMLKGATVATLTPKACHLYDCLCDRAKVIAQAQDNENFSAMGVKYDLSKIVIAEGERIHVVDLKNKATRTLIAHPNQETKAAGQSLFFVVGSPLLVDIRKGGKIRFWNVQTGQCLSLINRHEGDIRKFHCDEEGKLLTMSGNGLLVQWNCRLDNNGDLIDPNPVKCWNPHEDGALWDAGYYPLSFNENGSQVIIANDKGSSALVDLENLSARLTMLNLPDEDILIEGCYGRDDLFATLSKKNRIYIWDPRNGSHRATLVHESIRAPLLFSDDGESLLSGLERNAVAFWHYGSIEKADYIKRGLSLEQGLLLLLWLDNNCTVPEGVHLNELLNTIDPELLGNLIKESSLARTSKE